MPDSSKWKRISEITAFVGGLTAFMVSMAGLYTGSEIVVQLSKRAEDTKATPTGGPTGHCTGDETAAYAENLQYPIEELASDLLARRRQEATIEAGEGLDHRFGHRSSFSVVQSSISPLKRG